MLWKKDRPLWVDYLTTAVFAVTIIGSMLDGWTTFICCLLIWAIGIVLNGKSQGMSIWKSFKFFGNIIDTPWDKFKEWVHCGKVPFMKNKCWNIAFMMKNRGKPYWPIIRECKAYDNCDPEDKGENQ